MRPVGMRRIGLSALLALGVGVSGAARADAPPMPLAQGPLSHTDLAAAQRGFLVYQGVCASCHTMNALHYRDLERLGLTPAEAGGIAAAATPPATLDSRLKGAGKVDFGGAVPPDLSTIAAQRKGGARYIYDFLTGYVPAPDGVTLRPGHYYNTAFPGGQVAMPPALHDNAVKYADGTPATTRQEAADVATFLAWSADPNLTARHEIGLRAVLFFIFLSFVALGAKRRIWRERT